MADLSGDLIFAGTVQTLTVTTTSSMIDPDGGSRQRKWVPGRWEMEYSQGGVGPPTGNMVWVPGHYEYTEFQPVSANAVTSSTTVCEYLKIHWDATQDDNTGYWTVVLTAFMCPSSPGIVGYTGYLDGRITVNGNSVADLFMASGDASCYFGDYGVYEAVKSNGSDWSITVTGLEGTVSVGISANPGSGWQRFCNSCGYGSSGGYGFDAASKQFSLSGVQPVDPDAPSEPSTLPVREVVNNNELVVLDTSFIPVAVIDEYESAIWTERYCQWGDFELALPVSEEALANLKQDYYLYQGSSYYLMIIESIKLETDAENGDKLIVSGRSLESILERRVIWEQTVFSEEANTGNFQNAVKKLLDDNIISPQDPNRQIPNVLFRASNDPTITRLRINTEFDGETVYDAIQALCEAAGIGFRLLPDANWNFVFELYSGTDHSYSQPEPAVNSYVIFSTRYDNLSDSNYLSTTEPYRNTALVAGEGEGASRIKVEVTDSGDVYQGLNRREIFVDAKSTSSDTQDGQLSQEEYEALLEGKGLEKLADNTMEVMFDGEALPAIGFEYGADYALGDIVQVENAYGLGARVRVTEYIMSHSTDGREAYPTFTVL